jgi:hypothetical protein
MVMAERRPVWLTLNEVAAAVASLESTTEFLDGEDLASVEAALARLNETIDGTWDAPDLHVTVGADRLRDALRECVRLSGEDLSDGFPTWPELPDLAVEVVKQLRDDYDEACEQVPLT